MAFVVQDPPFLGDEPLAAPLAPYSARIPDELDRSVFDDAVRAAGAGASRAAYVMIWVACVESLRRKFQELGDRDLAAQRALDEIDGPDGNRSGDDAIVLEEARHFGFISDAEYAKLAHMFEMRSTFSRPSHDPPSAEALQAAASDAVEIVLGRGTKLRSSYLKDQLKLIAMDRNFLPDDHEAVCKYATEVHDKSAEDLHLWFVQTLCRGIEAIYSDGAHAQIVRRGVWFASTFLSASALGELSGWDIVADLSKYPSVLSEVLSTSDLFASLSPHAQDIVVGQLLAAETRRPVQLKRLEALHNDGVLSPRQIERFIFAIESMSLGAVASVGLDPSYYAAIIVRELKSRDWPRQNAAVDVLRNVGRERLTRLHELAQRALGNNVVQAADGMAREAVALLEELSRSDDPWPKYFIEGIVSELLINDKNAVRFKGKYAREAFLSLRTVPEDERGAVVTRVVERIRQGTWVGKVFFSKEVEQILDVLQNVGIMHDGVFRSLRPLAELLATSKKNN
ncbi:MAG: hypothetical protein M3081_15375 [Gemmatimonadota bacterium]|nr:hypothetical protein [Gemmatimonadota bacterium]